METIKDNQRRFKLVSFANDVIECEVSVPETGEYLSSLIPFDKNWKIYVDGTKTESIKLNVGFLGCKIAQGTHQVVFSYEPRSFYIGTLISILAFVLCLIFFIPKKLHKIDKPLR